MQLPLTGAGVVDMVITESRRVRHRPRGRRHDAHELAPDVTLDDIKAKTEAQAQGRQYDQAINLLCGTYAPRMNNVEKREPMEVGIPRADLLDAVLAHENGGMRIVEELPARCGNSAMTSLATSASRCVATARRSPVKQRRCTRLPSFLARSMVFAFSRMRCHAQKSQTIGHVSYQALRSSPLSVEPSVAGRVKLRMLVGSSPIRWCQPRALPTFHRVIKSVRGRQCRRVRLPLSKCRQRRSVVRFRRERSMSRSAVSTSSDMVRPCRAASRLSSAMTVSSILRVVFIWKAISPIWSYGKSSPDQSGGIFGSRAEGA